MAPMADGDCTGTDVADTSSFQLARRIRATNKSLWQQAADVAVRRATGHLYNLPSPMVLRHTIGITEKGSACFAPCHEVMLIRVDVFVYSVFVWTSARHALI